MSIALSGASGSYFFRNSGAPSSTGAFTVCFWTKRTANFEGMKLLYTVRPNPESSGHDILVNDPYATPAYRPVLQANWAATQQRGPDPIALNVWTFVALVGSGSNISLKIWDGSAYVGGTVAQTAFSGARERWGDGGAGTSLYTGLFAHMRVWNAALSEAELSAERVSETAVRSSNLLSAHSGGGGSITAALTGQTGTAYTNGGAATYSSDMPAFSSFTGTVISGTAQMPSESVVVAGSRYNRILYSGDLSNAVWNKQSNAVISGAVPAPQGFGIAQRIRIAVNTGGIYQTINNVPAGLHVAVMAVRRVDSDNVAFRHMNSGFNSGAQGHFNLLTGSWGFTANFGTHTAGTFGSRALANGWYLIWVGGNLGGGQVNIEFFPVDTNGTQIPAINKSLDVAAFQYEAGSTPTYHKPTEGTVVTRSVMTANLTLSVSPIGVGQQALATVTFQDSANAPWDQHGPITFISSNPSVAALGVFADPITDLSGRLSTTVTGVAQGTSAISATDGTVSTLGEVITVGATSSGERQVEILVEEGWQGTTGWFVAVFQRHPSQRFPTTKLFEAAGQAFQGTLYNGQSRMLVAVPTGVTLNPLDTVEIALENDNVAGSAVDGPGIFTATVI